MSEQNSPYIPNQPPQQLFYDPEDVSFQASFDPTALESGRLNHLGLDYQEAGELLLADSQLVLQGVLDNVRRPVSAEQAAVIVKLGRQTELTLTELAALTQASSDRELAPEFSTPFMSVESFAFHEREPGTYWGGGGMTVVVKPPLREWLKFRGEAMSQLVAAEMARVYLLVAAQTAPEPALPDLEEVEPYYDIGRDFWVECRDDYLTLTVFGNCACLHYDPQATWQIDEESYGLSTHNIDTPAQLIALLAGMGLLARLAAQSR